MKNDKQLIYLCAFRYALGRRSYIVRTVVEFIINHLGEFTEYQKKLMIKEIKEREDLGDNIDKKDWIFLKETLENNI